MESTFKEKPRGMMEILSPFINEFSQLALIDFLAITHHRSLVHSMCTISLSAGLLLSACKLVKRMVPCNSFGWK
jgi:hypothetical protein